MIAKCTSCLFLLAILMLDSSGLAGARTSPSPSPEAQPESVQRYRLAPVNPDFVAWRAKRRAGEIAALAAKDAPGGLVPSPFDDSYLRATRPDASWSIAAPTRFDLRTYDGVTSVKDQGGCGACFAFATCSSLESWLLMSADELWDFSENHIKNYSGFDSSPCQGGGNPFLTAAYLARWAGPVEESDDPFHDWDEDWSPGGPVCKYVKTMLWFYDPQDIKNAVMTYGALFAPIYLDPAYHDPATNTYHHRGSEPLDHAVAVIGWDDSKYVPGATTQGAWLVKNSWGATLDYFYVSYENRHNRDDAGDIWYAVAYCDAVEPYSYLHNYQYDELGFTGIPAGAGSSTLWAANVFTAAGNEDLAAVGFYALAESNTTYAITVYDTISRSGSTASFRNPLASVSGTASHFGYHTVALPSRVPLDRGDDFAVVVKFTTPGTEHPVPLEMPVEGYSSMATANAGEGYLSVDGQSFDDVTAIANIAGHERTSVCIKGLTVASSTGGQSLPGDLVEVAGAPYASLDGLAFGSQEAQDKQRQAVQQLGLPLEVKTRRTGIVFRLVPAGTFTMGSPLPLYESMRGDDENQHQVTLTRAFYCGQFEVTQGQWQQVMGSNPSFFQSAGAHGPVERVSWNDCQTFARKLCQLEGVPEGTYCLLTESQWEYACRAGTATPFCYGKNLDSSLVNFDGNWPYGAAPKGVFRQTTVAVGSFRPNAWGLYDMHGNVWEWCQDWYGAYPTGSVTDPSGPASGDYRTLRGGSWDSYGWRCRSAARYMGTVDVFGRHPGLRLARAASRLP